MWRIWGCERCEVLPFCRFFICPFDVSWLLDTNLKDGNWHHSEVENRTGAGEPGQILPTHCHQATLSYNAGHTSTVQLKHRSPTKRRNAKLDQFTYSLQINHGTNMYRPIPPQHRCSTDVPMFLFGFGSFSCTSKPTTNIKSQNNPMWRRMPGLQGEVKSFDRSVFWHHGVSVCEKKHVCDSSCAHRAVHQPRDPRQKQDACSKALQEPAKVVKTVKPQNS